MADRFYPKGLQHMAAGDVDYDAHDFKIAALPAGYTFDVAHEFVTDLGTIIARSGNLASKANTAGSLGTTLDAADPFLSAVASGSTIAKMALFRDTGVDATSILLGYWDSFTATATNDNNVNIVLNVSGLGTINSP